jgi:amino acid transporter
MRYLPSELTAQIAVINAGVLTSAFSAGNSGLYGTSRQIYGMALRGQAPRIFAKTTKVRHPATTEW